MVWHKNRYRSINITVHMIKSCLDQISTWRSAYFFKILKCLVHGGMEKKIESKRQQHGFPKSNTIMAHNILVSNLAQLSCLYNVLRSGPLPGHTQSHLYFSDLYTVVFSQSSFRSELRRSIMWGRVRLPGALPVRCSAQLLSFRLSAQ